MWICELFRLNQNARFTYTPIDISEPALRNLTTDINNKLPDISVNGLVGDYFQLIEEINNYGRTKKILLFLGPNIGNFNKTETLIFLNKLKAVMHTNDLLFIGFDLKKDPQIILNAYNDGQGLTADFNLNLLTRINNELDANFDLQSFKHHEVYNPQSGSTKSYLIS
ncbi:MAG: L-histidine N(alpha)-methyltransferase [Bacteroidetes bacterium]|nr:L-histidine N(alpha)-methyltransferase [Bacteroidota bacterium]